MPDWCFCDLHIDGQDAYKKVLLPALNYDHGADLMQRSLSLDLFNTHVPITGDSKMSLLERRVKLWGVKWDTALTDVFVEDNSVCVIFDSPWSPPIEGVDAIAAKFPELQFVLEFEANEYTGRVKWENGKQCSFEASEN